MHVRQVAAEGAGLHRFPTPRALDVPRVLLSACDTATLNSLVRVSWKLGPIPTQGTDHRLHLGRVCLKPHPLEQAHEKVQRAL